MRNKILFSLALIPLFFFFYYAIEITYPWLKNEYQSYRLARLKNAPDCVGSVIAEIKGVRINFPRQNNIKIYYRNAVPNQHFNSDRPTLEYGCEDKIIYDVKNVEIYNLKPDLIRTSIFREEHEKFYDKTSIINKETVSYYSRDADGKLVQSEGKVDKAELANGITKITTPDNVYFILPIDKFQTKNSENVLFNCKKNWNPKSNITA